MLLITAAKQEKGFVDNVPEQVWAAAQRYISSSTANASFFAFSISSILHTHTPL